MSQKEPDQEERYSANVPSRQANIDHHSAPFSSPSLLRAQHSSAVPPAASMADATPTLQGRHAPGGSRVRGQRMAVAASLIVLATIVVIGTLLAFRLGLLAPSAMSGVAAMPMPSPTMNATAASATYVAAQAFHEVQPGCGQHPKLQIPSEAMVNCTQSATYSLVTFKTDSFRDLPNASYNAPLVVQPYSFVMSIDLSQWSASATEIYIHLAWADPGGSSIAFESGSSGAWSVTQCCEGVAPPQTGMTQAQAIQHVTFQYTAASKVLIVAVNGTTTKFTLNEDTSFGSFSIVAFEQGTTGLVGSTVALANFTFTPQL